MINPRCGFVDIVKKPDGTFECSICGRGFPATFLTEAKTLMSKSKFYRLNHERLKKPNG